MYVFICYVNKLISVGCVVRAERIVRVLLASSYSLSIVSLANQQPPPPSVRKDTTDRRFFKLMVLIKVNSYENFSSLEGYLFIFNFQILIEIICI